MPKIRIMNGPMRGREKTIADKAVTIGRDAEAGIQILDRSASRFHCEIFPVGGMYFVRDLDSKNGTYINDEKLGDEELLRLGDVIKIGTTELGFEQGHAVADEDSSSRISYNDDPDVLSNTLEFRLDELSDLSEPAEQAPERDSAKGLRLLYQVGRIITEGGDPPEREARALDCLLSGLPADCALLFRRDPATGKLAPSVVRTAAPNIQPVISRSIIKKTFTENKALHSANAQEDDRFSKHASISIKGIRSVISVPLTVSGQVRGVLYLSRGTGAGRGMPINPAFDQVDLELVSSCAVQIGLAEAAAEERRRHRASMWQMLCTLVRTLESKAGCLGAGERCSRTCLALATAMHLDPASRERVRTAGLLHHFSALVDDGGKGTARHLALLEPVGELESVLPLVRQGRERLDGRGPLGTTGDDLDTEARILGAAMTFEERTAADPGADQRQAIEAMAADPGLDRNVVQLLLGCHLDGSLYQA